MYVGNFCTFRMWMVLASIKDADVENGLVDLRTRGGGKVSWDEVREWHGLIYTTKCKIDS